MRDTQHWRAAKSDRANKNFTSNLTVLLLLLCLAGLTACGSGAQGASAVTSAPTSQPDGLLKITIPATQATVGVAYSVVPSVSGGDAPFRFSIVEGTLPPGLALNPTTGSITGTPSVAGTYSFTLYASISRGRQATDEHGSTSTHIVVSAAKASGGGIAISPTTATITSQGSEQFTAQVTGSANTSVTWSASVGTISSTGAFVAPKVTSDTPGTITVTSAASPSVHATATITVTPVAALAIANSTIPEATISTPYAATLSATGGVTPYQWSLTSGSLPSGIQLQASSGAISGLTALAGSYNFTAKVTDSSGKSVSLAYTLTVSSSSAGGYDGPAELPRIYIQSAMVNTPAPGVTTSVNAGGSLQTALNNASCGDTIQLQAGATFTGPFTFPAKSCDDNDWIIVRTSSPDSALPAEGSRLTPCYAGVSSLPGRPAFNCASTQNVMAKLVMAAGGSGPVIFATGANHYRLTGLEITRSAGIGIIYALAVIDTNITGGTANNLILDRVWMHGTAQDDTKKGIELGGISYASVIDSFFTDFHCVSITGTCTDASAIGGGIDPVGPFKFTDNFLEASGENILFGGGPSTITPADMEISRNHFFKPLTWLKGQPGYVGGANGNAFIVKNLFELKNAQRVLLEANIMEDSWGGFSQDGFAIVITPVNQTSAAGVGMCPLCQVTDITIRYNTISHVASGIQLANPLTAGVPALDGERYSIHDLTIDDVDPVKYGGSGIVAEIESVAAAAALIQNVSINHLTVFAPRSVFSVGALPTRPMVNFSFTNSIFLAGTYPIWSTGGTVNCANYDKPLITFNACFSPYSFASNALIATPSNYPPSLWPTGNFFPASVSAVQFVNYNNGIGGNYQLLSTSPYHNAATDGTDLGANIATIVTETTGVY